MCSIRTEFCSVTYNSANAFIYELFLITIKMAIPRSYGDQSCFPYDLFGLRIILQMHHFDIIRYSAIDLLQSRVSIPRSRAKDIVLFLCYCKYMIIE